MEHHDMSTFDLFRRCYVDGADVHLDGDGLRLSGCPVPDDLLGDLKTAKADVLALMTAQGIGNPDNGADSIVPRRYAVPLTCLGPRACSRLGPHSQSLMQRHCNPTKESRA